MKTKLDHLAVAVGTLSLAACMTDDPAADPDPATQDISAQIQVAAAAASSHQLVNLAYGQCVDAPNGTLNVMLQLSSCKDRILGSQKWMFVGAAAPSTFYLVNQQSGFCAEVNNGTSIPGERVDQWHCDGSTAEQWVQSFRSVDGVSYQQYRHAGTDLCLDTVGGAGSQLMQWNCDSSNDAQTWLVR